MEVLGNDKLDSLLTRTDFSAKLGHSAVFLRLINALYSVSSSLDPGEFIGTDMTKMQGINCIEVINRHKLLFYQHHIVEVKTTLCVG